MINVKLENLIIYAKVSSTSSASISYDAWVSVGSGMKKKESATVSFSIPRNDVSGEENALNTAVQTDLSAMCLYLDFQASPKDAYKFLKETQQKRFDDEREWQSVTA